MFEQNRKYFIISSVKYEYNVIFVFEFWLKKLFREDISIKMNGQIDKSKVFTATF